MPVVHKSAAAGAKTSPLLLAEAICDIWSGTAQRGARSSPVLPLSFSNSVADFCATSGA